MEKTIRVAQIVELTEAEGPGKRLALWVQGCPFRCKGCCNPHMLKFYIGGEDMLVSAVLDRIAKAQSELGIEGVSFLGGEPMSQAPALAELARGVQALGLTVMIYTGYSMAELTRYTEDEGSGVRRVLNATDLLVDGRYEESLRTTTRRWVGSSNQVMHFLSEAYRPDDPRFSAPNTIEIHVRRGKDGKLVTLNGWPLTGAGTKV